MKKKKAWTLQISVLLVTTKQLYLLFLATFILLQTTTALCFLLLQVYVQRCPKLTAVRIIKKAAHLR